MYVIVVTGSAWIITKNSYLVVLFLPNKCYLFYPRKCFRQVLRVHSIEHRHYSRCVLHEKFTRHFLLLTSKRDMMEIESGSVRIWTLGTFGDSWDRPESIVMATCGWRNRWIRSRDTPRADLRPKSGDSPKVHTIKYFRAANILRPSVCCGIVSRRLLRDGANCQSSFFYTHFVKRDTNYAAPCPKVAEIIASSNLPRNNRLYFLLTNWNAARQLATPTPLTPTPRSFQEFISNACDSVLSSYAKLREWQFYT